MTIEALSFGELTKLYRERRGLNQRELAQQLQISSTLLSKWERGLRYPSLANVQMITQTLTLSLLEHQNLRNALDYDVSINLSLHELLSIYLDRSELTETEIARRLKIGRDKLRHWRRGQAIPTNAELEQIIEQVGLDEEQAEKLRYATPQLFFSEDVLRFIFAANRQISADQLGELVSKGMQLSVR